MKSEELIKEVTLNKKRKQKGDNFLKEIRDVLLQMPEGEQKKVVYLL